MFERYTPLPSWPPGLRIPLPYTYLYGVATMRGYDELGTPSWFWGKRRSKGSVWYFPILFLIKNPLAWLAGLALAVVAFARRQRPDPATAAFGLELLQGKVPAGVWYPAELDAANRQSILERAREDAFVWDM